MIISSWVYAKEKGNLYDNPSNESSQVGDGVNISVGQLPQVRGHQSQTSSV